MADRNTGDLRTEWDLADHEPLQILSIEDQSRLAVPCKDGTVIICTPFEARLQRLPVDADAKIRTVLWNPSTGTTLLIGQENIFEWDPTDNSVVQIRSHDVAAPRNAVWNPSTTHFAIGGNPVTVLNGRTFESTLTTNTTATELSWLSDDELAMVGDRGNSLTRVKLSQADKPTTVQLQATISGGVFSPTAPVIAGVFHGSQVRFLDRRNGAHLGTFVQFGPYDHAVIAPDGRIVQASPGFRQQIVYQIRTDRGQETLRPAEFFARFGGALSN